jgi:hypothetical protein
MLGTPEKAPRHAESINNIADEHNTFGVDTLKELIQFACPGALETEVNVRQKQRPYLRPARTLGVAVGHDSIAKVA